MNPILIEIQGFTIFTFWVLFGIGFISAIYLLIKLSVKNNLKLAFLSENSWKMFFWAIVGARIFSLIENYKTFFAQFDFNTIFRIFEIWDKGLNIWGGIVGLLIYFYLLCQKKEQNFSKWLDVLVPSIIFGLAFGHLGAFFEGINYGTPTELPWGVNFESPKIKFTVPIHPTQIYAFLYSMIISIGTILLSHTKKIQEIETPGFLGLLATSIYAFFSFLEELIRGDDTLMLLGIRIPLILSLLIAIFTGTFLYLRYNKPELLNRLKKWKP